MCTYLNVAGARSCEMCMSPLNVPAPKRAAPAAAPMPDLSADALLLEMEQEDAAQDGAAAATEARAAGDGLACLICRTPLENEYRVLPGCAIEHVYCTLCMEQLRQHPEKKKRRIRRGQRAPDNSVTCAFCGQASVVDDMSQLRRFVEGAEEAEGDEVDGFCWTCWKEVKSNQHEGHMVVDREEGAKQLAVRRLSMAAEMEERMTSLEGEAAKVEKRGGEVGAVEERLLRQLREQMEQVRAELAAKETEMEKQIREAAEGRRKEVEEESRRLREGAEVAKRAREGAMDEAVSAREAFNWQQRALAVRGTGESFAPEQMGAVRAGEVLQSALRRLKYVDGGGEAGRGLLEGLPMGLQDLMSTLSAQTGVVHMHLSNPSHFFTQPGEEEDEDEDLDEDDDMDEAPTFM